MELQPPNESTTLTLKARGPRRMQYITAKRMILGGVLKYLNGLCAVIHKN